MTPEQARDIVSTLHSMLNQGFVMVFFLGAIAGGVIFKRR